jgi:hypothetical protein
VVNREQLHESLVALANTCRTRALSMQHQPKGTADCNSPHNIPQTQKLLILDVLVEIISFLGATNTDYLYDNDSVQRQILMYVSPNLM